MSEALESRRLLIHGRVQGVGFRWWTRRRATAAGLSGWVRNRADGSVEIAARGPREALEGFRRQLEKGPPGARVDRVEEQDLAGSVGGEGFDIAF